MSIISNLTDDNLKVVFSNTKSHNKSKFITFKNAIKYFSADINHFEQVVNIVKDINNLDDLFLLLHPLTSLILLLEILVLNFG
jgi:hypothetical protein